MSDFEIRSEEHTIDDAVEHLLILSDVHAHLPPLAVFDAYRDGLAAPSRVLFNGDLFYGGPKPAEAARWVRENAGELVTIGNHDEGMLLAQGDETKPYTEPGARGRLSEDMLAYFAGRPHRLLIRWRGRQIVLMHGHRDTGGKPSPFTATPDRQIETFGEPGVDLFAMGHTHYPFVREIGGGLFANSGSMSLTILGVRFADRVDAQSGEAHARADGDVRCSFLDVTESDGALHVKIVRFEYDREATIRDLIEAGYSDVAGFRRLLATGILEAGAEMTRENGPLMASADEGKRGDIRKVLDIARLMAATNRLEDLFPIVVERSMELLHADRGSLFLYEPETAELVSYIAAGEKEIRFPADRGIAGAAVQTGETIHVPDAYADPRFNPDIDKQTGFRTRNVVAVPLRDHEERLVGVLQVLNKRDGVFTEEDISLAETLGAQAGVALQRARLFEEYTKKQEMERAMKIAREIQRNLLPEKPPAIVGFDMAGFSEAADDTGGDAYDYLELPDGRCMFFVADASGHGIGPALVMTETRAMLRAVAMGGADVPTVLRTVNTLLTEDLASGRFVTCFLGILDPKAETLVYSSAGHGPMLFYHLAEDRFDEVAASEIPLGIMPETDYTVTSRCTFKPGDFLVVCTDGFFEATNRAGEEFGLERLRKVLRRHRACPAVEMIQGVKKAVSDYSHGQPQGDDLTVVVLRKL